MDSRRKIESGKVNWLTFFVGCAFLILACGLAWVAFEKRNLTDDERRILFKWALPVASAITSGAFAGVISVNGALSNGLRVGAIGGFAVWLISLFFHQLLLQAAR